ncbi:hypothetical protein HDU85_002895 [Gaertneriomyces sp. JEL0708]|nr:hypothetical protein HDU85_002895 [Gaertneriomyces sp. JEL0708]
MSTPSNRIPTLSDLYREGRLFAIPQDEIDHNDGEDRFEPDEDLNQRIAIWRGDITKLEVDAIVNAANKSLLGGGGVDGAIHRAAGPELVRECRQLNGCQTGDAKITGGYNLPARHVIHTVGPVGEKPQLLEACYMRSLEIATKNGCRTVAFPCISTGIYGYPNGPAAHVVLRAVRSWLEVLENKRDIDLIVFCVFLDVDVSAYRALAPLYFPPVRRSSMGLEHDDLNGVGREDTAASDVATMGESISEVATSVYEDDDDRRPDSK